VAQHFLLFLEIPEGVASCQSFDSPHSSRNPRLLNHDKEPQVSRSVGVGTAAELAAQAGISTSLTSSPYFSSKRAMAPVFMA